IKLGIGVNKSDSYKMVVSFGDSIAAGSGVPAEDTYQSMIANLYGAEVKNLGYGGFSYSSHNGGASLTTKLDEFPSSADRCLVLIQAGTNDFTLNAPAGLTTSNGNATVSGALKEIVTTIKSKMPYSDIIILSPIKNSYGYSLNKRKVSLEAYSKAIMNIASAYGYKSQDLFNEPGFNLYAHTCDSIHLSTDGHYFVANAILNRYR
nr:SGNH/GDSL hydrolase family protein [Lachnospiraceae bacterium]